MFCKVCNSVTTYAFRHKYFSYTASAYVLRKPYLHTLQTDIKLILTKTVFTNLVYEMYKDK